MPTKKIKRILYAYLSHKEDLFVRAKAKKTRGGISGYISDLLKPHMAAEKPEASKAA